MCQEIHSETTSPPWPSCVTIVGLGLLGGSIARSIRRAYPLAFIQAVVRDPEKMVVSTQEKVIDSLLVSMHCPQVYQSDILFICTPINLTIQLLKELDGKLTPKCIVTDVGSTKAEIMHCIDGLSAPPNFIGGHPMAGKELSGYMASSETLLMDASYLLLRSVSTTEDAWDKLFALIHRIGAKPIEVDAHQHDALVAAISHLPHLCAYAMVHVIAQAPNQPMLKELAAGGFRDVTRIASSNPQMWEQIFTSNKQPVCAMIDQTISVLTRLKDAITSNDSDEILSVLTTSKEYRDSFIKSTKQT